MNNPSERWDFVFIKWLKDPFFGFMGNRNWDCKVVCILDLRKVKILLLYLISLLTDKKI